jgi:hypothetical protein
MNYTMQICDRGQRVTGQKSAWHGLFRRSGIVGAIF